jgi:hypothetical protein
MLSFIFYVSLIEIYNLRSWLVNIEHQFIQSTSFPPPHQQGCEVISIPTTHCMYMCFCLPPNLCVWYLFETVISISSSSLKKTGTVLHNVV